MCVVCHSNRERKFDPTYTATLRNQFAQDMSGRFSKLASAVRKIFSKDMLGIRDTAIATHASVLPLPDDFFLRFRTSDEKVKAFMQWLEDAEEKGILEIIEGDPRTGTDMPWSNLYIEPAYKKGMRRALSELNKAGLLQDVQEGINFSFFAPFHADRLALLYTRVFSELRGITKDMDRRLSEVLTSGMLRGASPIEIGRDIVKQIGISKKRAILLARTEIIRAHHKANIAEYRRAGVEGVVVMAEWLTAGDERVCPDCDAMNGKRFTLDDIEDLIPLHPLCRCVALPWKKEYDQYDKLRNKQ